MTETQQKIAIGIGAGLLGVLVGRALAKPSAAPHTTGRRAERVRTTVKYVSEPGPNQIVITDPGAQVQIRAGFDQLRAAAAQGDKRAANIYKANGPAQGREILVEERSG